MSLVPTSRHQDRKEDVDQTYIADQLCSGMDPFSTSLARRARPSEPGVPRIVDGGRMWHYMTMQSYSDSRRPQGRSTMNDRIKMGRTRSRSTSPSLGKTRDPFRNNIRMLQHHIEPQVSLSLSLSPCLPARARAFSLYFRRVQAHANSVLASSLILYKRIVS